MEDYVLGISDLSGELMRYATNCESPEQRRGGSHKLTSLALRLCVPSVMSITFITDRQAQARETTLRPCLPARPYEI